MQDASRSLNKSFGIFNEATLHCSSNIAQDLDGYRSLPIAAASVNRAMPGSYYSDVERTIYLTYYVLLEDVQKYDALFKEERKFLSFEYYSVLDEVVSSMTTWSMATTPSATSSSCTRRRKMD